VRHSAAIAWPDVIRRNLASFQRVEAPAGPRGAAVSVCVLDGDGDAARILVAKRVARGRNPGQWALPGGSLDAGESVVDGALRELAEEAGVSGVEVAGLLDDFVTDSGFVITPVVVLAPPGTTPQRDPAEIASLHEVALATLVEDDVPRWNGALLQMKVRHDMVIHAPTGALLYQFREVALLGRATRVAGFAQPDWTRA